MIHSIGMIFLYALAIYGACKALTERSSISKSAAILWCLQRNHEGFYLSDLANITGMSRSTVLRYLVRFEVDELVRTTEDKDFPHRRRYFLRIERADQLWEQMSSGKARAKR